MFFSVLSDFAHRLDSARKFTHRVILVKIAWFVPYAMFWEISFGFKSERDKKLCQGVCKFGITGKWKVCCIWENGEDFCNFEKSLYQGMVFDTKTWTCYWKGVFAPMFWQGISFSLI